MKAPQSLTVFASRGIGAYSIEWAWTVALVPMYV